MFGMCHILYHKWVFLWSFDLWYVSHTISQVSVSLIFWCVVCVTYYITCECFFYFFMHSIDGIVYHTFFFDLLTCIMFASPCHICFFDLFVCGMCSIPYHKWVFLWSFTCIAYMSYHITSVSLIFYMHSIYVIPYHQCFFDLFTCIMCGIQWYYITNVALTLSRVLVAISQHQTHGYTLLSNFNMSIFKNKLFIEIFRILVLVIFNCVYSMFIYQSFIFLIIFLSWFTMY